MATDSRANDDSDPTVPADASIFDEHYGDLDQILAATNISDESKNTIQRPGSAADFDWPTRNSIRGGYQRSGDSSELSDEQKPDALKLSIHFLAAFVSASIACWFGAVVVMARFTRIDHVVLHPFFETITNINEGRFGLEAISSGLKFGFVISGWLIWLGALTLALLALGQLINALVQLFVRRPWWRWIDGMVATCGVLLLFLFIATLFLHASHITKLKRDLHQFDSPQALLAGVSELQNVQRLREEYETQSRRFTTVILVSGIAPLSVFGLSMLRMLTTPSRRS